MQDMPEHIHPPERLWAAMRKRSRKPSATEQLRRMPGTTVGHPHINRLGLKKAAGTNKVATHAQQADDINKQGDPAIITAQRTQEPEPDWNRCIHRGLIRTQPDADEATSPSHATFEGTDLVSACKQDSRKDWRHDLHVLQGHQAAPYAATSRS